MKFAEYQSKKLIGDIFTAEVRDLASDGRGIVSHPSGLTVFVAGIWKDEQCQIKLISVKNKHGTGKLLKVLHPSPFRVSSPCSHHGVNDGECGGCPWQFIDYQQQLLIKQEKVKDAFSRLNFQQVKDIWPSANIFGYRNRAQLKTDGKDLGYLSANSHTLAKIEFCPILNNHNQETLANLIQQLPNKTWQAKLSTPKNRRQKTHLTQLNIDDNLSAENVAVNKRLPFRQSNDAQNERMKHWLTTKLSELNSNEPILELFCGNGNFTEIIAKKINSPIVAAEADSRSIANLSKKNLANVKSIEIDLFSDDCFEKIYNQRRDFATLVLDPPRDGLKITNHLLPKKSNITNIFYISCNLATLCRDLEFFKKNQFKITEVQALDMSPHTPHIEVLVHLSRK